jgi:hypothetical protein
MATAQAPASSCGSCGGSGKHGGLFGHGDPCGSCGGSGWGKKHHGGDPCGSCGGAGCGLCGGGGWGKHHGGDPCGNCGGAGCGLCLGKGGALLGAGHALLGKVGLGGGHVQYFVGPGGPVPLTPGYVPYVNPVRSPRDFFAFPPLAYRCL